MVLAALLLAGCAVGAATTAAPTPRRATAEPVPARALDVRDAMPAFWEWRAAAQGEPLEKQADGFLADFAPRFPHVYREEVLGKLYASPESARAHLVKYLGELPMYEARVRAASASIPGEMERAGALLRERFPGAVIDTPVVIAPSLFSFDGATRVVEGRLHLYFAPDGMVRWHDAGDDACVFFTHELFHVHHARHLPESSEREPLWAAVWREGLATYVSGELCGVRDEGALLLQRKLPVASRAAWTKLVTALEVALDTTDEATYWSFFGGRAPEGLPERGAYFVGLHVARRIATRRPLGDLPRLTAVEVAPLVHEAVRALRAASAPPAAQPAAEGT